jgi:hypothetical protein
MVRSVGNTIPVMYNEWSVGHDLRASCHMPRASVLRPGIARATYTHTHDAGSQSNCITLCLESTNLSRLISGYCLAWVCLRRSMGMKG